MSVKLYYPATQRNTGPLLEALSDVFRDCKRVLEIASGSGEHLEHFAPQFPSCRFVPSDLDAQCLASIDARVKECPTRNIDTPVELDVTSDAWPSGPFDAVFNANMVHIAPWAACEGLMRGVAGCLRPEGLLCLYGPFSRGGKHTAPSNADFSEDLKRRNLSWGVRDLDDVTLEAEQNGLALARVINMPANNLTVLFRAKSSRT